MREFTLQAQLATYNMIYVLVNRQILQNNLIGKFWFRGFGIYILLYCYSRGMFLI